MRILMILLMALVIFVGCAGTQVKHRHQDCLMSHVLDAQDLLWKYKPKSHYLIQWPGQRAQHISIAHELADLSCRKRAQWVVKLEKELKMAKGK